jgi:hypothetical protein
MVLEVDYSDNNNNDEKFTGSMNDFMAENSLNFVNSDRTFNQWTGIGTDPCSYKQRLNLATKPIQYYVNSLNNISGLNNNDSFLSFTPVGNATQVNVPNLFDRAIPSTLNSGSSVYTHPHLTSPFFGSSNNINVLDTDTDLMLKTGLTIRSKNNQSELSQINWPSYGDIHSDSIEATVQNAGQLNSKNLPKSFNKDIPGLNNTPNEMYNGIGVVSLNAGSNYWVSSTNALQNYINGKNLDGK